MQLDLNSAQCIINKSAIGKDVITNICNGKVIEVSWQFGDYFGIVIAILIPLFLIFLIWLVYNDLK